MASQYPIPKTPRVISPTPTPSETSGKDSYFPPTTRSKATRKSSVGPIQENHEDDDPELRRARSRSRSPHDWRFTTTAINGSITSTTTSDLNSATTSRPVRRRKDSESKVPNGTLGSTKSANGFLSPESAYTTGFGSAYWRNLSRSPSPFGLIPIHREWRAFVHKHEVPRKFLHVSIGFVTLGLYCRGVQSNQVHPVLLTLLVPIFAVDLLRFRWPAFNRFYIRVLGAFMRESEAHDRFNGVVNYLAGVWVTMFFCRKDVAVVSVLLLSWCDTAASTFGRAFGKYTPRIRRGKSLAGSIAAFTFGAAGAMLFWGLIAPATSKGLNHGVYDFAFNGQLTLPSSIRTALSLDATEASISGPLALGVVSIMSGFVASASEAVDLWGLDDNLTIPILCGLGLSAFMWAFSGR